MDRYEARINLHGTTQRERVKNRLINNLNNKLSGSLSYKDILLNGEESQLIINTGTKPYYKEFQSLPNQKIVMGDYIEWSNRTWLVYEADADDEIYTDGKMYECNYKLYWQDAHGNLVSKMAFIQNASSYNNGEEENKTITLASNQFMVWMPLDEDTIVLRNGKKMFIDNYELEPSCYKLTRPDTVSMKFGEKGCTYYIFTQTESNKIKDKLVELEDGTKVWLADYIDANNSEDTPNPDETTNLMATITFKGTQEFKIGGSIKTLTGSFVDTDNNVINDVGVWEVITIDELLPYLEYTITDNKLKIKVLDTDLIDGKVRIIFSSVDGSLSTHLDFKLVSMF